MTKRNKRNFGISIGLFLLFIVWTIAISNLDVQAIGPENSKVGFAAVNRFCHELTGVHLGLYLAIDWLQVFPFALVGMFGLIGFIQLIRRKSLLKVDADILILGGFYVLVMAAYLFFEKFVVNYRPVLIEGVLEASYPSSTTMLLLCVMPTAMMQINSRLKKGGLLTIINVVMVLFTAFMVIGRLISGVHWFTDIVGGSLLSGALVMLYTACTGMVKKRS